MSSNGNAGVKSIETGKHEHGIWVTHYGLIDQPEGLFFISRELCNEPDCNYEKYRLGEAVEI